MNKRVFGIPFALAVSIILAGAWLINAAEAAPRLGGGVPAFVSSPPQSHLLWADLNITDEPSAIQPDSKTAANATSGLYGVPDFQKSVSQVMYDSGWSAIDPGVTMVFTHNLGGDPDFYSVELWQQDTDSGGYGINHRAYGGMDENGAQTGSYWANLTGEIVKVTRLVSDTYADQVRVRIWQAAPPEWDSDWVPIAPGEVLTMNHNLGGNADDYLVGIKFRDTEAGGLGVHQFAYGGFESTGLYFGAAWLRLTNASVQVWRFGSDTQADEVRLMIYLPNSLPAYDSDWLAIAQGSTTIITHELDYNPTDYIIRTTYKSPVFGINSLAAGGMELNAGEYRGLDWENLTGETLSIHRFPNDIYGSNVRVRIWQPFRNVYLPLVVR
jgi:hypothetical protein